MTKLTATLVFVATLAAATSAAAHAESPLARKVQSFDGDEWVLRTNFGIISSDAPDRFVCEEAFLGGDRFFVAPVGPTTWVTFGETSIHRTEDGCDFERVQRLESRVEDVDVDPSSSGIVYVSNGDDAGVFYSGDAGQSFAPIGDLDPDTYQITTVRFYDSQTVIVGSYERDADGRANIVTIDVDSGETTALPLPEDLTFPYVIAAGGDRVVFNARAMVQSVYVGTLDNPVLHTRPQVAGQTWPTGAAVSDDGSRIYLSGVNLGRGVDYADWNDTELTWQTMVEQAPVGCVEDRGDDLLVCSSSRVEGGEADLTSLATDGATTMPLVVFENIQGPREACPEESDVATVCPLVWPEVAPALGADYDPEDLPDAGTPAVDAANEEPPDDLTGSTGCATAPGDASFLALLALLGWLFGRRKPNRETT